jgi:hypothetical protein
VVFHGLIQTNSGLILVFQGLEPTQTMKPWWCFMDSWKKTTKITSWFIRFDHGYINHH